MFEFLAYTILAGSYLIDENIVLVFEKPHQIVSPRLLHQFLLDTSMAYLKIRQGHNSTS
jgi:hypothetical protein